MQIPILNTILLIVGLFLIIIVSIIMKSYWVCVLLYIFVTDKYSLNVVFCLFLFLGFFLR